MNTKIIFMLILTLAAFKTQAADVSVRSLSCVGANAGSGSVSITFLGGDLFNITNINVFGFPFTQNARLYDTYVDSDHVVLKLKPLLMPGTLRVNIDSGYQWAALEDERNNSVDLSCKGSIEGFK